MTKSIHVKKISIGNSVLTIRTKEGISLFPYREIKGIFLSSYRNGGGIKIMKNDIHFNKISVVGTRNELTKFFSQVKKHIE